MTEPELVAVEAVRRWYATFGDPIELTLLWAGPHLGARHVLSVMAVLDGTTAGVATGVRATGAGGESVGIFGVGVLEQARLRGVGSLLSSYVAEWGFGAGASLAWLNPDTDPAARLYQRLGFVEVGGFDIYVDN